VPFIYEDRISEQQMVGALQTFADIPKETRKLIGQAGRQHVINNFNFTDFISRWDKILTDTYNNGVWSERKHKSWELKEIA
jgi:glycosyltransferase involved in cell wall biosynthesis